MIMTNSQNDTQSVVLALALAAAAAAAATAQRGEQRRYPVWPDRIAFGDKSSQVEFEALKVESVAQTCH